MAFTKKLLKRILNFLMLVTLSACTKLAGKYAYSSNISKSQLIDGISFLGMPVSEKDLPAIAIMMITPEMEVFLEKNTTGIGIPYQKAITLGKSIVDKDKPGLIYEPGVTCTASQVFENGQGNCLAFSFLYLSLARDLGLDVNFQEVNVLPPWRLMIKIRRQ